MGPGAHAQHVHRVPEERLRLAIGWNRLAARLAAAGEKARADA